jgi:hypothetical protein
MEKLREQMVLVDEESGVDKLSDGLPSSKLLLLSSLGLVDSVVDSPGRYDGNLNFEKGSGGDLLGGTRGL